ncbi:MAG: hypothetical protein ABFD96_22100 [Armatimonadia bacterium]
MADDPAGWFVAPPDWEPDQPNPFSAVGTYAEGWSCLQLSAADDDVVRNGREPSGLYMATFGRRTQHLRERLGDFLRYETGHGRRVIVALQQDTEAESFIAEALAQTSLSTSVRPHDPRWVVHSTTIEAWTMIERCGELRSAATLAGLGSLDTTLGERLVGDPPDYAQYVALGTTEAIGPEFVVACRQAGKMLPNPDTEYQPGVRLYFDAHLIIQAGLAVRDGLHTLKVRDRLPLQPYLVAKIGVDDLPPLASGQPWTTTEFLRRANGLFESRLGPQ